MIKCNYVKSFCLLVLVSILLLSSCGSRNSQTLFNAATDVVTDTIRQVYVVNDQGRGDLYYKIKINDLITIRNLQNKEWGALKSTAASTGVSAAVIDNTTSYKIEEDGTANLPAIGKILLVGLTQKEAAQKLQDSYGNPKYLIDPIIELKIVNLKVTVLGEFGKQGNFLLEKENTSLIELIAEAGGLTKTADPKTLKIIRGNRSNPEIIYVNLNDIKSLASRKLILQNNDIIYIQPTKDAALAERLQKSNNIIQPILVIVIWLY